MTKLRVGQSEVGQIRKGEGEKGRKKREMTDNNMAAPHRIWPFCVQ